MFDYIKGILVEKFPSEATVEAGGVGYLLTISFFSFEKLPDVNAELKLFTHHHVREDLEKLYGFITKDERALFRELITVNGIGPKVAMSILSALSAEEFVSHITTGNIARLKSIPGIGIKTAERLIVELKGKLKNWSGASSVPSSGVSGGGSAKNISQIARSEAFAAMATLGYSEVQIEKAFGRLDSVLTAEASVQEWIKKALQII